MKGRNGRDVMSWVKVGKTWHASSNNGMMLRKRGMVVTKEI